MSIIVQEPVPLTLPSYGLWVAESIHGPGFKMGTERHDFHQIYIVQRGMVLLDDERLDEPLSLVAGSLWPIPAGVGHHMEDTAESILLLVCLHTTVVNTPTRSRLWQNLCADRTRPIVPHTTLFSQLLKSLSRILAEQWQHQSGYDLLIGAELDRLLVHLARMRDTPLNNDAPARVQRVISQVKTTFYETWDIDRAASMAHLSRRRFTTIFREATGSTFNDYVTRIRLEHAKALLRGRLHSIPGAAFASGIADVSHFYRLFKKANGCTPGTWIADQSGD